MDIHPNGNLLATYGKEGKLFVWDLKKQMKIYEKSYANVSSMTFSIDGTHLIVNKGYTSDLWDYASNTAREIQAGSTSCYSKNLVFIANSYSESFTVAKTSKSDRPLLYDSEDRKSNNGELLIRAIAANSEFTHVATFRKKEINLWDISEIHKDSMSEYRSPTLLKTFKIPALQDSRSMKIVSNDSLINFLYYDNYANETFIHLLTINVRLQTITQRDFTVPVSNSYLGSYSMIDLDLRANLSSFAASFYDESIRNVQTFIWDLKTGVISDKIPVLQGKLKLHPTENKIVFGDKAIQFYEYSKGISLMNIPSFNKDYGVRQILLTKDRKRMILSTTYSGIDVWDMENMKLIRNIKTRADGDILDNSIIRLSHDNQLLAYVYGNSIQFYDLSADHLLEKMNLRPDHQVFSYDFSADDQSIITFGRQLLSDEIALYRWTLSLENDFVFDNSGASTNRRGEIIYHPKITNKPKEYSANYLVDFSESGESMVIGRTGLDNFSKGVTPEIEFISFESEVQGQMIKIGNNFDYLTSVFVNKTNDYLQINSLIDSDYKSNHQYDTKNQVWKSNGDIHGNEGVLINNHYYFSNNQDSIYKINLENQQISAFPFVTYSAISVDQEEKLFFCAGSDNSIEIISLDSLKSIAKIFIIDSLNYYSITPDFYYKSSKNGVSKIGIRSQANVYKIDQFDMLKNRPDIIIERLGLASVELQQVYRKAYEKRIKKQGNIRTILVDNMGLPEIFLKNTSGLVDVTNEELLPLEFLFRDSSTNLASYQIAINGVGLYGEEGVSIQQLNTKQFELKKSIQLSEGINRIQISCQNSNGLKSLEESIVINYQSLKSIPERTYFIGIGIDKFKEPNHDLSYSVKDVRDLSKALKEKLGDQLTIDTLFNQNVNISNVQTLKKRLLETNINDKVIISYSGHGLLNKDYDYFLSSYTVDFEHPENGGIPYEVLEDLLDSIPARKKLLLIDACHSGEVDKEDYQEMALVAGAKGIVKPKGADVEIDPESNTVGLQNSFQLMQELFVNVQKGSGATIISAAAGDQFALEGGKLENGFFTYAILQYMKNNDEVGINSLKKYVYEEVERLSGGLQKPTSRIENLELDWKVW